MIEDRILTRTTKRWCEETRTWRTEYERVEVQIRWPGEAKEYGYPWQLESRHHSNGNYTCNGSPGGCERGRFGQCEYCDRKSEAIRESSVWASQRDQDKMDAIAESRKS